MSFSALKLIRGRDIVITDKITLHQPTLGEIEENGEEGFMNTFWMLCSAPYDMPSLLDDMGVDFMKVSTWEFFINMSRGFKVEDTKLVFGDLDFSELEYKQLTDEQGNVSSVLCKDGEIIITEEIYNEFIQYIKEMIGFQHEGRKAANKTTARILIEDDRKRRKRKAKKEETDSMLLVSIISLVNTEEFPYNYETVFDLTLYQLTKSLQQIQNKKNACALLQGSMSGFVDTKGISYEEMSWIYSSEKLKPKNKKLINNK